MAKATKVLSRDELFDSASLLQRQIDNAHIALDALDVTRKPLMGAEPLGLVARIAILGKPKPTVLDAVLRYPKSVTFEQHDE